MPNPFAQFAPTTAAPAPAAPAASPTTNAFAQYAPAPAEPDPVDDAAAPPKMDTWSTRIGSRVIHFQAPTGATKQQIREAARAAGVKDPEARSLSYGDANAKALDRTAAQEKSDNSYGMLGSFLHQGADFVVPFVDEAAAGLHSLFGGGNYMGDMRHLQERSANSEDNHPWASNMGKAAMTALTLWAGLGGAKAATGEKVNVLGRTAKDFLGGAAIGGSQAYGNNDVEDRWNGVPESMVLGGGIGVAARPILGVAGNVISRVNNRLGISERAAKVYNYLTGGGEAGAGRIETNSAVRALADRTSQDPVQMRARAADFRANGVDPALVNVVDESGRGQIGALARKPGKGRQVAQQAADAKALGLPDRMDAQVKRVTTDGVDPAIADQMGTPVDDMHATLKEGRNKEIETALDPVRANPIPMSQDVVQILNTAEGRRAIGAAARTVTDPEARNALLAIPKTLSSLDKSVDARMPQAIREQITSQIMDKQNFTVDMADRIARKFNAMADNAEADTAPVLRQFARTIRDHAKGVSPEYAAALDKYGSRAKSMDALATGQEILTPSDTDGFVKKAGKLSDTPNEPFPHEPDPAAEVASVSNTAEPGADDNALRDAYEMFKHRNPARTDVSYEDFVRNYDDLPVSQESGPFVQGDKVDTPHGPGHVVEDTPHGVVVQDMIGRKSLHPAEDVSLAHDINADAARFAELPPIETTPPEARQPVQPAAEPIAAPEAAPAAAPPEAATPPLPSDRQLATMGARRAVQEAVGNNIANAPGVARRLATAPEQHARTNALLGPVQGQQLTDAMRITTEDLRNFADIAPRTGSQTALRTADDQTADAILHAAASVKTGKLGKAAMMALNHMGLRDQDVERIVSMAVDPSRTNEIIDMLEKRLGGKEKAARAIRVLGMAGAAAVGKSTGGSR